MESLFELWKDVPGFEGVYKISSFGRLKSYKTNKKLGYILSNKNGKGGYLSVVLEYRKKKRYTRMHRLVAEAFIENPNSLPQVNHKDGDKQNNFVDNLEWVSGKQNVVHAIKMKPSMLRGMVNHNRFIRPKTIVQLTLRGEYIAEYPNSVEAQKATGVCQRNILQVASREEYKPGMTRKQAGGFRWVFKEELSKAI